jgi:RND family efflux transporter MFP subunit
MFANRRRFVALAWVIVLGAEAASYGQGGIRAITRPSADIVLSFVQPGRVVKVHFKEGDFVKADQILVQQEDAVEQAQLLELKAESEDTTKIRAGEASLAQRKVDLQRLEMAAERKAATPLEVEHARLDVKIAELSLELAKFERDQAGRKCEEQKARIASMKLRSPIEGQVEKVDVEAGESVNALAQNVQVVQIDPLWIDVPVPVADATGLHREGAAAVEFPGPAKTSAAGRIIFVGTVADAASGTLRVRVEVPNKARRPAGEHVMVSFQAVKSTDGEPR